MNPEQSKDTFEAAAGRPETPPDSPLADDDHEPVAETTAALDDDDDAAAPGTAPVVLDSSVPASDSATAGPSANPGLVAGGKEEEEEHMDVELSKLPSGDPDKTAKMQLKIMRESGESFPQRLLKYFWDFFRGVLFKVLLIGPIPRHIAFIMDGNRRFALNHNLKAGAGHQVGFLTLMSVLQYCYELGVKYITIYAFSIENFKRSPDEVARLMELMLEKMEDLLKGESILNSYGIKVNFMGNLDLLSARVKLAAEKIMVLTAGNKRAVLSVCVAYTCTHEIVHSVQETCRKRLEKVQEENRNNGLSFTSLEDRENDFIKISDLESHMYSAGIPDPDMLIRTSGEGRLSNFLLWQTSFCNLIAAEVMWPEFSFRHLIWAILKHQQVHRYLAMRKR